MSSPSSDIAKCASCGASTSLVCASCLKARFCSPACASAAWAGHRAACAEFSVLEALPDEALPPVPPAVPLASMEPAARAGAGSSEPAFAGSGFSCAVCGSSNAAVCMRCRLVGYCGAEHQRKDWKAHSRVCAAAPVLMSAAEAALALGRELVLYSSACDARGHALKPLFDAEALRVEAALRSALPQGGDYGVSVCFSGSVSAGTMSEMSDLDLTVVFSRGGRVCVDSDARALWAQVLSQPAIVALSPCRSNDSFVPRFRIVSQCDPRLFAAWDAAAVTAVGGDAAVPLAVRTANAVKSRQGRGEDVDAAWGSCVLDIDVSLYTAEFHGGGAATLFFSTAVQQWPLFLPVLRGIKAALLAASERGDSSAQQLSTTVLAFLVHALCVGVAPPVIAGADADAVLVADTFMNILSFIAEMSGPHAVIADEGVVSLLNSIARGAAEAAVRRVAGRLPEVTDGRIMVITTELFPVGSRAYAAPGADVTRRFARLAASHFCPAAAAAHEPAGATATPAAGADAAAPRQAPAPAPAAPGHVRWRGTPLLPLLGAFSPRLLKMTARARESSRAREHRRQGR